MIIRHQCSKLFALPTCSVRKTGKITDVECISLPCIRKTGLITDGECISLPCIRKTGEITDGASILPPCIRKTGEITDGECISLPSIRKTGLITDGASKIDVCALRTRHEAGERAPQVSLANLLRAGGDHLFRLRCCARAPASQMPRQHSIRNSARHYQRHKSRTTLPAFLRRPATSLVSAQHSRINNSAAVPVDLHYASHRHAEPSYRNRVKWRHPLCISTPHLADALHNITFSSGKQPPKPG